MRPLFWTLALVCAAAAAGAGDAGPTPLPPRHVPGDVFREYPWTTERMLILGKDETPVVIPGDFDLEHATRAEVEIEIANEHLGFEGMAIRLNEGKWRSIDYPASSPREPSPSLWFHHWYPRIPVDLADLHEGPGNTFDLRVPRECFDGTRPLNGDRPLEPWLPVYGVTVRVYYDPARKPHPTGRVLTPAAGSAVGQSVELTAEATSPTGKVRQVDFIGRYRDVGYEGDGVTDEWHGHLFHGRLTHHLGSTTPEGRVTWDTSWVPDQPGPMEIAARIADETGLVSVTDAVGGLTLRRPGLSVELCRPTDVPRSFTGCQYGTWIVPGVRTQKFRIEGDLTKMIDARFVIASWGDFAGCHGYTVNGVPLEDKPAGDNWLYNLSTPPIRPLGALRAGENTFSTVVGPGRVPDIYMPGVQVLIRYRTDATPPR